VIVAVHNGRKYLKTAADGYSPDNLLALPECRRQPKPFTPFDSPIRRKSGWCNGVTPSRSDAPEENWRDSTGCGAACLASRRAVRYYERELNDIRLLSVGTTSAVFRVRNHAEAVHLGLIGWARKMTDLLQGTVSSAALRPLTAGVGVVTWFWLAARARGRGVGGATEDVAEQASQ